MRAMCLFFFFFNDTATTEIYTLSLHDALPISGDSDRAVYIATSCAKSTVLGLSSLVNGGAFPNLSYDDSI